MSRPKRVTLYEVGPRDGLQAEAQIIPSKIKIDFINRLSKTGLSHIEATSFVSPKWIPQLADNKAVFQGIRRVQNISYPVLVPNLKGLEAALESGAEAVAIFAAASESFSQKNINATIAESLSRFGPVRDLARAHGIKVRGYVSCVIGCPYEGMIAPDAVLNVASNLLDMGCYEVSLGDTIGVGTPAHFERLLGHLLNRLPVESLAVHCHDTYGQALANILVALEHQISIIDSSVGGLGGCPYAPGSAGNVATEDVLYMLKGLGIETGVDLYKIIDAAWFMADALGHPPRSKVALAKGR